MKEIRDKNVSLLIPAYNVERFLPDLIENARKQTVPFHEIIVYDDASDDKTASVASSRGVNALKGQKNRGSGYARNQLLKAASTDYVHFHDADDVGMHPRFLEMLLPFATKETAVFSWWKATNYGKDEEDIYDYPDTVDDWIRFFIGNHVHLNATIYPRAFLEAHGGFDATLKQQQDIMLNIAMAAAGLSYQVIPEVLAEHHRRSDSTINQVKQAERERWALEVCERCVDLISSKHHNAVVGKTLYHTGRLLAAGDESGFQEGVALCKRLGLTRLRRYGRLTWLISATAGLETAMRYKQWRAKGSD